MRSAPSTRIPAWLHIAIFVCALLLGHDALMAMSPHDTSLESAHHDLMIEQCGVSDGTTRAVSHLPTTLADLAAGPADAPVWFDTSSVHGRADIVPGRDASSLRAMLQVFLN